MRAHPHHFAHSFAYLFVVFLGWLGGRLYPAPPWLIGQVSPQALVARARGDIAGIQGVRGMNWTALQSLVGSDQARRLADDAVRVAQQAGSVIKVEHVVDEATKEAEMQTFVPPMTLPEPAPPSPVAASAPTPPAISMPVAPAPKAAAVVPPAKTPPSAKPAGAPTNPVAPIAEAGATKHPL